MSNAVESLAPAATPTARHLAVPVMSRGRVLGLLYVDSAQYDERRLADRQVLTGVAAHFEAAHRMMSKPAANESRAVPAPVPGAASEFRLYARDNSVFMDGGYLVKGVAGALLWKMLKEYAAAGRTDFCYRELRLDPALRLPDFADNIGARLILLQQRLAERCPQLRIEKLARGLVRLVVLRPVRLAA